MRRFRVDSYDAPVSAKSALMAKSALSRRWVDFYHKMLNMGILGLYNQRNDNLKPIEREIDPRKYDLGRRLQLKKLILASHLSN